jgi:GTP cyclohydrolase IA
VENKMNAISRAMALEGVKCLLRHIGEDSDREGLQDTPLRVVKAYEEMLCGYQQSPTELLSRVFTTSNDEMIVVKDIPFNSLCEHHLMPFWGTASIGYLPAGGRIVGLSKLPRLVKCFALRLQIQENFTEQIAVAINDALHPLGVGVVVKATHACMQFRGIHSKGEMVTSKLIGAIKTEASARSEFLALTR